MKSTFTTSITHEGDWVVAQCLEVDVASQAESEEEALFNLREALALHFIPPVATALPGLRTVEARSVPLGLLPYRGFKRKREVAGVTEVSQRSSTVNVTLVSADERDSACGRAVMDRLLN